MGMGSIRALADEYFADLCELDPILGSEVGIPGTETRLTDFSPAGAASRADLARAALSRLANAAAPTDSRDERCRRLMLDRLNLFADEFETGAHLRPYALLGGPLDDVSAAFDNMPTASDQDWEAIAARLAEVPAAMRGIEASGREGLAQGLYCPPRQVASCIDRLDVWAGQPNQPGYFGQLAPGAPVSLQPRLVPLVEQASAAISDLAQHLRVDYLPRVEGVPDAVGVERYLLGVRRFLGSTIDLADAYSWGWEELARVEDELRAEAHRVLPGATVAEARSHLDRYGPAAHGEAELLAWLQDLMDSTVERLDGRWFDFAPELRRVEAKIAPAGGSTAQYYTQPSKDFSRPGRTWFPLAGRTRFPLWGEVSTCYHEGVPGHHQQMAQWVLQAPNLSLFQATMYLSGNIEGWALYAERLMDELGFLDQPGSRLGYLGAQQFRATRVVVDIGMHCAMPIPRGQPFHPGARFTPELGRAFLGEHSDLPTSHVESEWLRYLGWAGQAICYKLGERVWLTGRDEAHRRQGSAFDLRRWHMNALNQGSLGLDDLAEILPGC